MYRSMRTLLFFFDVPARSSRTLEVLGLRLPPASDSSCNTQGWRAAPYWHPASRRSRHLPCCCFSWFACGCCSADNVPQLFTAQKCERRKHACGDNPCTFACKAEKEGLRAHTFLLQTIFPEHVSNYNSAHTREECRCNSIVYSCLNTEK